MFFILHRVPEDARIAVHIINESAKTPAERARAVTKWQREGGAMIIGYEMFRKLTTHSSRRKGKGAGAGGVGAPVGNAKVR